jgi:hypothetical protein
MGLTKEELSRRRARERDRQAIRIRLGALKDQALILARKQGHSSLSPYLRELISRGVAEDLKRHPATYLTLRPNVTVYKVKGEDRYSPLVKSLGGERVWMLAQVPGLPSSMGGGTGYLCDITAGKVPGGVEGRGVLVLAEDVT